ncbi:ankyrin [Apiospora marii]|uniref:Ankyrin n=1 Tax=Apiospora marii TaxID=335849 RepID=A0ABR1SQ85_9PEZI
MEGPTDQAGCYIQVADDFASGNVDIQGALRRCLTHLGLSEMRHQDDHQHIAEHTLSRLFWKGSFGPIAASIQLCEQDPLATSISTDSLLELFSAAAASGARLDAIQSSPHHHEACSSPLFRQALLVTAIQTANPILARELVYDVPLPAAPAARQNLFALRTSPLSAPHEIPQALAAGLIAAGWVEASPGFLTRAACSEQAADGIALFEALRRRGVDLHARPLDAELLPEAALVASQPALLIYLAEVYPRFTLPPDAAIRAVEVRGSGGVDMLRYLLEDPRGPNLDVNLEVRRRPTVRTDPRDRAEREHYYGVSLGGDGGTKTALRAAAARGNADAVAFLLERGARKDGRDDKGRSALDIAKAGGHVEVVNVLRSF